MRLRRVAKGIVRKGKKPSVYRIGFNNGDETELTANGINELEELWLSLCPGTWMRAGQRGLCRKSRI